MSLALFIDVDQTLTRGFIQQHFARKLGCDPEYQAIEDRFQQRSDPRASSDFGKKIIDLFAQHGLTAAKARKIAANVPLRAHAEKLLSQKTADVFLVSNGPSYYIETLAKNFDLDLSKNVICSRYAFEGRGGVISDCIPVTDMMKRDMVQRNAENYDMSIGVGDNELHDGPFLSACTISMITRREDDEETVIPSSFPLLNDLSPVLHLLEELRRGRFSVPRRSGRMRLFVGSSSESRAVARCLHSLFSKEGTIEPRLWEFAFEATDFTMEGLEEAMDQSDFAAFVCAPDDIVKSRGKTAFVPRDNVLFELGLFMGRIGRKRCFVLTPNGTRVKLPSDLMGITELHYEGSAKTVTRDMVLAAADQIIEIVNRDGYRMR